MVKLSVVSGETLIKYLLKHGFQKVRQKGSHVSLRKRIPDKVYQTVVPLHKNLATGTLLNILRQCGIPREDFLEDFK